MKQQPPDYDKLVLSYLSLALLVVGLLFPFVLALVGGWRIAVGFAAVAVLLSLVFGLLSLSEKVARIVTILGAVVVGMALITSAVMVVAHMRQRAEERAATKAELEKSKAKMEEAMKKLRENPPVWPHQ